MAHPSPSPHSPSPHSPSQIGLPSRRRAVSGNPKDAAERLYEANISLVPFVLSHRFAFLIGPEEREDMYGPGLLGLYTAACRYDPSRGAFSTFAYAYIRGYIQRAIKTRQKQARVANISISLETVILESLRLGDNLPDPRLTPEKRVLSEVGFEMLLDALEDEREQDVIRAMYQEKERQAEIAESAGMSRSRVGQIHRSALKRLRTEQSFRAESD